MSYRHIWIGWSRDSKGKLRNYHTREVCNTLTSQPGGVTKPLVIEYELD